MDSASGTEGDATCPTTCAEVDKMITLKNDDIFSTTANAIVNPVNTVGVMGSGLAKLVRDRFPACFFPYRQACQNATLKVGHVLVTELETAYPPYWIIHFPTKKHWSAPSQLTWIDDGLFALRNVLIRNDYEYDDDVSINESIAIPALGCGLGGLRWEHVQPLIEKHLADLSTDIQVYLPQAL